MSRPYPYEWVDIPQEEVREALNEPRPFCKSVPGNVLITKKFTNIAEKIYNFEVRPDDFWIVTYPKCGTTWTQELVWNIVTNVDLESSKSPLFSRTPYLEYEAILAEENQQRMVANAPEETKKLMEDITTGSVEYANKLKSPRVIKSHLPLSMLPPELFTSGCKIIYVCRNPKDACVSYFHFQEIANPHFKGDFEKFEKLFMEGKLLYGNYWFHLKDALKYENEPNLKILWYEEMKRDFVKVIQDLTTFLDYSLTEEKILLLADHLNFGNVRKRAPADEEMKRRHEKFYRKGTVGDWKNYLTGETLERWDSWIKENLKGTGLDIVYEL